MEKEINGIPFEIRPLTRGEIKSLRKKGLNIMNLSQDLADDAIDEILEMVLRERTAEIDAMPNACTLELCRAIIELTYGGEAEKN